MIVSTTDAHDLLTWARRDLAASGIEDPALESRVILGHALGITTASLVAAIHEPVSAESERQVRSIVARRLRREPLAYLLGHREFYGLDFLVDQRALVPRPETEHLVEATLALAEPGQTIVDVGTGSGAIVVSLAVALPACKLIAIDLSEEALDLAAENARRHGVADRIDFRRGDLLEPVFERVDLIVANLPYVAGKDVGAVAELAYEPRLALDGGEDGLDVLRRFFRACRDLEWTTRHVLLEIGASQGDSASSLAAESFPLASIEVRQDYAGLDRLLIVSP